ncbi:hypothetical protein DFJ74DRAFT_697117 [Hyaloraphidium curvatum]|nr:hypothetical protein DFJ74DRAFT_697117 [Hyaloraphidium curvatum]
MSNGSDQSLLGFFFLGGSLYPVVFPSTSPSSFTEISWTATWPLPFFPGLPDTAHDLPLGQACGESGSSSLYSWYLGFSSGGGPSTPVSDPSISVLSLLNLGTVSFGSGGSSSSPPPTAPGAGTALSRASVSSSIPADVSLAPSNSASARIAVASMDIWCLSKLIAESRFAPFFFEVEWATVSRRESSSSIDPAASKSALKVLSASLRCLPPAGGVHRRQSPLYLPAIEL